MKYKPVLFKVIHCDGQANALKASLKLGITKLAGQIAKTDKGRLPIILNWRFRLLKNDPETFSFIADDYYILTFEKTENDYQDLKDLIDISYRKYVDNLCETVFKEKFVEYLEIKFDEQIKTKKAKEILEIAKLSLLLD